MGTVDLKEERRIVFESEGEHSDQLADIVEESLDETGAGEIREGHEQIVARLDPTSTVKRREKAQLWADTAKLHLFDPENGESLRQRSDISSSETHTATGDEHEEGNRDDGEPGARGNDPGAERRGGD